MCMSISKHEYALVPLNIPTHKNRHIDIVRQAFTPPGAPKMAEDLPDKHKAMVPWIYDLGLWIFTLCLDIFFRQVYPRGAWRVPKNAPVIIVAGPHNNQFVDSLVLMRILKSYANRRVSFLIAEKSMKEPYIGTMAGAMGALPVARGMDKAKAGKGTIYLPNPDDDPTLIYGEGTDFTVPDFMEGGSIILPKAGKEAPATQTIAEIVGPTELRLKNPLKTQGAIDQLTSSKDGKRGSTFKVAPHIDQSKMFDAVFHELLSGGCVGIFPEGGSHDRPNLLPLKPGAAIMALGLLARDPNCGLTIIPCGMNYFHAHKFRSRAVIEFGHPVAVHPDQIEAYKQGGNEKRNAVGSLLETIHTALAAVTQLSPDHETLQLIQASRRLYSSANKKMPLSLVIEFNRRLLQGYSQYQNDPRVVQVKKSVLEYNRRLLALGIKDHQIEWGNLKERPWGLTLITLFSRVIELLLLSIGTLPGLLLFWPVFVISKIISVKKQRKALAASEVKLQGRDIVSTWKILVAMGLAPALYVYYTVIMTAWLYHNRHAGYYSDYLPWWMHARTYIPDFVPLWLFSAFFFGLMIVVTFAALRIGEIGMDVLKSLPPLLVALNPRSASTLQRLRARRQALSVQITDLINKLGPEVFPDFDPERIAEDTSRTDAFESRLKSMPPSRPESRGSRHADSPGVGLFGHSTSFQPLSTLDHKDSLTEVNKKIRDAMQERGQERGRERRQSLINDHDDEDSD
ncbi:putative acyltransferase [Lachnellula suecica]|uniref:Putative acyltransferase n=1 Tax=Lachnellula suecica TaxID=602035 RepID=A0A8T9CBS8_9HELO|nr:putative acyltransferase [Lachnellula suecica]